MYSTTLEREAHVNTKFLADVKDHEMTVVLNQGVHRHLRFRAPKNSFYWFDILTSPGVLTINGDMGSFTFSRLNDMFEFFHGPNINPQYWHEKLTNDGGSTEYSEDLFWQYAAEHFLDTAEEWADHPLAERNPAELWWAIRDAFLDEDGDDTSAHAALAWFEFDGYRFHDTWEWDLRTYSFRYLWNCWAIRWAIEQFRALPPDTDAALRAARSASQQVRDETLNAENTRLRQELATVRAKLECSQLALGQAVKELAARNGDRVTR
jgi:hypothetical protein